MRGGHDLGGNKGFGPICPEPESIEPFFHADWERTVFALTLASGMLGRWNLDESRHARESQQPADYLRHSYYENWLVGLEKLLVEKRLVNSRELATGCADAQGETELGPPVPSVRDIKNILSKGSSSSVSSKSVPKFKVGDKVRVKENYGLGHTRAPTYAMNAIGTVASHHGCHIFPDSHAAGTKIGEHLYSVIFTEDALWENSDRNIDGGLEESSSAGLEVAIDLWEPYLQRIDNEDE